MNNAVIGFPRIGKFRELKFASEKYFRKEIPEEELQKAAQELRLEHWRMQRENGADYISSNDFSFYDGMLDLAVLLNAVPKEYKELELSKLDTYFAMARGYQGEYGDVKAFAMKKWFNTNYHYIVPELDDDTELCLAGSKVFDEYREAKEHGFETKPVLIGVFTFLKLSRYRGGKRAEDYLDQAADAYSDIIGKLDQLGAEWVQFDEPALVTDLTGDDIRLFIDLYRRILGGKGKVKVLLQTYFGDIRDCYGEVTALGFDGIGLDFVEGIKSLELVKEYGFPEDKVLFAGIVNGRNVWKCSYKDVLMLLSEIRKYVRHMVIGTSCSLLHVPYTLENEIHLKEEVKGHFAFAKEKVRELKELCKLSDDPKFEEAEEFINNEKSIGTERLFTDMEVQKSVARLTKEDFIRSVPRKEREVIQKKALSLPVLPTTTIGSFPQTVQVKRNRTRYRNGEITKSEYDAQIQSFIKECIGKQEEIGLDVLVHGEYERNDMVEFFGENLSGFVFTEKAWVQSYGTRCVKPPVIFGDIKRIRPITVEYSRYAQSLTDKPVKGMLTGPVTILNWSFPREDIALKDMAYQLALAVRDEVCDLERAGLRIIQIDEAALKEKLPLRRADWYSGYLDWAIPAFRLCHSRVKPETQIHTHMCYSEFEEIVKEIDSMDADVISFEASRSKLTIIDALKENHFETEVGPGVYDIHSPRVPGVDEIEEALNYMLRKIGDGKLWVNPDCGLKTRGIPETDKSLRNLVEAAKRVRKRLAR